VAVEVVLAKLVELMETVKVEMEYQVQLMLHQLQELVAVEVVLYLVQVHQVAQVVEDQLEDQVEQEQQEQLTLEVVEADLEVMVVMVLLADQVL
jgi:hypothetical protein